MELSPLTKSVLTADFSEALEAEGDPSRMFMLPFWVPVNTDAELQPALEQQFSPTWVPPSTPNPETLGIVTTAMLAVDPNDVSNIPGILNAYKTAGMNVFTSQLARMYGHNYGNGRRTFSAQQTAFVNKVMNGMLTALSARMPLQITPKCAAGIASMCPPPQLPSTFPDFVMVASAQINTSIFLLTGADEAIMNTMFPPSVLLMLAALCLGPYLAMCYYASYVPGPWNSVQRHDVSYYDQRYCELLLYKCASNSMLALVSYNAADSDVSTQLQVRANALSTVLVARTNAQVGGDAMKDMYSSVATLSQLSRNSSIELSAATKRFERRREHTNALVVNLTVDQKRMNHAKLRFRLWVAAFIAITLVAMGLILMNKHVHFMLFTGVVMFILSLYVLTGVVRGVLRPYRNQG